jgi:hypothetical protein
MSDDDDKRPRRTKQSKLQGIIPEFISPRTAGLMFGMSPWSARQLLAQGKVKGKDWGRRKLISYQSMRKYIVSMPDTEQRKGKRERLPSV